MSPDPTAPDRKPWWKGARGEWLVVAQFVLLGFIFVGPRTVAGWPAWMFPFPEQCLRAGALLILVGSLLAGIGFVHLGDSLTPWPHPKDGAPLVQTGAYRVVRHPIYSGLLVVGLGWAVAIQGWLTLGYVVALFVLLDLKSRREEAWLTAKFPSYAAYRQRVRKLIPFIY